MRAMALFLTLAVLGLLAVPAWAVDLSKINRSIYKEPVYQSKDPQYCGKVTPVTIEVPIEPMSWNGLFWDYLIWLLGLAIIAALIWIVWPVWRYIVRLLHMRRVLPPMTENPP
jgi:hypothetical protein